MAAIGTTAIDQALLRNARDRSAALLLQARHPSGHWEGELSSSALSTATAVTALALMQRAGEGNIPEVVLRRGIDWLARQVNSDGAWGDTVLSRSNISTTTLVWAAFAACPEALDRHPKVVERAEQWLTRHAGGIASDQIATAILARYGKDRTFSVPILTMCALAGRLGEGSAAWQRVLPLPFELAALPHQFFAALRLPVVSYALPALIAIGQVHHHHAPSRFPPVRWLREALRERTLRVLKRVQPGNGGFLEATPLTSFVTMSLAGCGLATHPVAHLGTAFLLRSQQPDGSWQIDTNLATWVTTLSVEALPVPMLTEPAALLTDYLLGQQYRSEHPYTHAPPGGWAWTHLPGGVPDADDTAGALVALHRLASANPSVREGALAGVKWLMGLQNRDGGIPTFCRGWGALPFDRSSTDITAHTLRAWLAWRTEAPPSLRHSLDRATERAVQFLKHSQGDDGAWLPLWFGNEHAADEGNPTYGTARALRGLAAWMSEHPGDTEAHAMLQRGMNWLHAAQGTDGAWSGHPGGPPSIEETALALEALASAHTAAALPDPSRQREVLQRGASWLLQQLEASDELPPAPIGFYFAKLWYYERLYPRIFATGALRSLAELPPALWSRGG